MEVGSSAYLRPLIVPLRMAKEPTIWAVRITTARGNRMAAAVAKALRAKGEKLEGMRDSD